MNINKFFLFTFFEVLILTMFAYLLFRQAKLFFSDFELPYSKFKTICSYFDFRCILKYFIGMINLSIDVWF